MEELKSVLAAYRVDSSKALIEVISSGLINPTWKVTSEENEFILQRINTNVFREPMKLAQNIRLLADYAALHHPDYLFISSIPDKNRNDLVLEGDQFFRLSPFVKNSRTINSVATPEQAYEAGFQFGKFTQVFSGFDATQLHSTIPNFHNLSFRYQQFKTALQNGKSNRIKACTDEIKEIESYYYLVGQYQSILNNPAFKLRVTHHDSKISNVLFDQKDKGICVIDLDTVMPGYFISDVGDMMRTYLSPTTEEERDYSKSEIRKDFFSAITKGYLDGIGDILSNEELQFFFYSGPFIIYMQAIRFFTDYLLGDVYYTARYDEQNLIRARNQLHLLRLLLEQERDLLQLKQ